MQLSYQKINIMNRFMNKKCICVIQSGYPPYYYLALVQVSHEDVMMAAEYAGKCNRLVTMKFISTTYGYRTYSCAISRVQNRYRYQCLIKYKKEPNLIEMLQQLIKIYRIGMDKKRNSC